MEKLGPLRIRYIIEDNKELQDQIKAMVKQDNIVQWLMHDELKQDQFKFLFKVTSVLFESAVRDKLLANDANTLDWVLPKLLAFKSLMVIRDIQLRKAEEHRKLREKFEREGKGFYLDGNEDTRYMTEYEVRCLEIDKKQLEAEGNNANIKKSDEQIKAMKDDLDREIYGRFWIWEGYYNEKNQPQWLETAEALKHVNNHVL